MMELETIIMNMNGKPHTESELKPDNTNQNPIQASADALSHSGTL